MALIIEAHHIIFDFTTVFNKPQHVDTVVLQVILKQINPLTNVRIKQLNVSFDQLYH